MVVSGWAGRPKPSHIGRGAFHGAQVGDRHLHAGHHGLRLRKRRRHGSEQIAEATGGAALFRRANTPGTNLDTGYLSHGQIGDTSQNKGLGASTGIYSAERLEQLADSMQPSDASLPSNTTSDTRRSMIRWTALTGRSASCRSAKALKSAPRPGISRSPNPSVVEAALRRHNTCQH